jgi:adenylate cyclase
LRGFTERSDRHPGEEVIALLNALFDAQAKAIADHGGEILKFIGDGLLSIFPIESPDLISSAATNALAAAVQAVEAAKALSSDGEPKLEIIVALHVGTAFYGNSVPRTGSILPSSDLR